MSSGTNENIVKRGLIIVITGGIASGKSFALQQFKILGFKTVSLDEIVADLYKKNNIASKAIMENFPKCVKNGQIDKNLLSNMVLQDHTQLKLLTSILKPFIRSNYELITNENQDDIVIEVPLIVESLLEDNYMYKNDCVILVKSSYKTRLERALMRKNMTKDKFDAIVMLQAPDYVKEQYADFIIESEDPSVVIEQIRRIINGRFKRDSFGY